MTYKTAMTGSKNNIPKKEKKKSNNLFNQTELIQEREKRGVYSHLPGITGLAQISQIDMSTPVKLAEKDAEMLNDLTIKNYFYYILATVGGKGQGDKIKN